MQTLNRAVLSLIGAGIILTSAIAVFLHVLGHNELDQGKVGILFVLGLMGFLMLMLSCNGFGTTEEDDTEEEPPKKG